MSVDQHRTKVRVLVAGVSTRAAAESAARAGFAVTTIDAFGDLDQHPSVRTVPLPQDPGGHVSAHAVALAARNIDCDAVVYLSNFENHLKAVGTLAEGRALWGNPPAVVHRVRDPLLLAETLRRRGLATPDVRRSAESVDGGWLLKPLASGGGYRIRPWRPAMDLPRGCYLQELIDGTPGSVVFVAAGGRAVPFGVSRQLVGEAAFGAAGYQYCGNILVTKGDGQFDRDEALVDAACTLARTVAGEFGVVGVNGIDFVGRDGQPYAIEINPRWCASMELVERAYGLSVFGAHADACAAGTLPAFDLAQAQRGTNSAGKAVVFARRDVAIGDTRRWLPENGPTKAASIRDVPQPGQRIPAGGPVCTVFAVGRDGAACHAALVRSAERVYADLAAWEGGAA